MEGGREREREEEREGGRKGRGVKVEEGRDGGEKKEVRGKCNDSNYFPAHFNTL